jgi:aspartyl protease family protein
MLRFAFSMLIATIAVAFLAGAVINGKLRVPLSFEHPAAAVAAQETPSVVAPTPPPPPAPVPVQTNSNADDQSEDTVEIEPNRVGQYETDIYIRGQRIHVEVDTGATYLSLRYEDAMAIGLNLSASDFQHQMSTANGNAKFAMVRINEVRIGGISVYDVDAVVSQPWALRSHSLLGMSVLGRLSSVHIADGRLVLER